MQSDDLFAIPPYYIQCNPCKKVAYNILRSIFDHLVDDGVSL